MKKIVVTSTTCPDLRFSGVEVVHVPLLETICLEFDEPEFDVAVFFSKHAVRCAHAAGVDLTGKAVWAVGDSTSELIASLFVKLPQTPRQPSFEGLVDAMSSIETMGRIASFELANGPRTLADAFDDVVVVPTYMTHKRTEAALTSELHPADAVLFASPRAVEAYTELAPPPSLSGSIGPTTTAALRDANLTPFIEADQPDIEALLTELVDTVRR